MDTADVLWQLGCTLVVVAAVHFSIRFVRHRRAAAVQPAQEPETECSAPAGLVSQPCGLPLYFRLHTGGLVPVDVSPSATVADLKKAISAGGGPLPDQQELSLGGEDIGPDDTELCDTGLCSEAVVTVRRVRSKRVCVDSSMFHCLALLDGVQYAWGDEDADSGRPDFGGRTITSVHAGCELSAALVDGKVVVWGSMQRAFQSDLQRLDDLRIVSCSASVWEEAFGCVDSNGWVHICGPSQRSFGAVPEHVQGRAAEISLGYDLAAVLLRDGSVVTFDPHGNEEVDLGGKPAQKVAAGWGHCAFVLEDGTVRCTGPNDYGECDVPEGLTDVVDVCCSERMTVALRGDGSAVWWGVPPATDRLLSGTWDAVAAGDYYVVAAASGGPLLVEMVQDGKETLPGLFETPTVQQPAHQER